MNDRNPAFPELSGTAATRDTLHAYCRVLSALRRAHAPPHPRWWHVSLRVEPRGFVMPATSWPGRPDASFGMALDLVDHRLNVVANLDEDPAVGTDVSVSSIDLREGLSGSALGDRVVHILGEAGIAVTPDRERYADETVRRYDPDHAAAWLAAFQAAECALGTVRGDLPGERGPIQLWPHHFDLAFECFGTRQVTYVEDGEEREATAQIGCGFSSLPSEEGGAWPYFYATPWPFDETLRQTVLPSQGAWVTEGWQGALLPYPEVRARGASAVEEFCVTVFELTRSRLE